VTTALRYEARTEWPVVGAIVLLVAGFFATVASFPESWNEDRTHGYVVAGFCLWLLWNDRRLLSPSREVKALAIPVAIALSLLWLVATIIGVRVVHQLVLPGIATAWAAALFGRRGLHVVGSIALLFLLAVPLWEVLRGGLQAMTVAVSSVGVAVFRLGARIDGQKIHFPFGTIEVAQSCAGLSYFMSAFTISAVYGRLFLISHRGRMAAIAVALVLAVVSNWVRVFGLVLIGYNTKMQSPLMKEHATYGWIIFAVVMATFFVLSRKIEQWDRQQPTAMVTENRSFDPDTVKVGGLWAPTAAALLGPLLYFLFAAMPAASAAIADKPNVSATNSWRATPPPPVESGQPSAWQPAFTGHSERRAVTLTRDDDAVQVDQLIYADQSQGKEMISGGNTIGETLADERLVGPLDSDLRMVRQAVVRTSSGPRLAWYWYRVAGVETPSSAKAKLLELVAFFSRGAPSELVVVSTACQATGCEKATGVLYEAVTGRPLPTP
jgi:EpsI family protein